MNKKLIILLSALVSNSLFAKSGELFDLIADYQNAKYEYGEYNPQSLVKQRKVQIYGQAKSILFFIKEQCTDEIKVICGSYKENREIVSCLSADRQALSSSCNMELSSFIGSQYFEQDFLHKGIKVSKGSYFFYNSTSVFNPETKVDSAVLTKGFRYKGGDYKNGRIDFNVNGLSSARLAYDQTIDGVLYSASSMSIFFHANGKVKSGILSADTEFEEYAYKSLSQITFDEDGKVVMGILAKDYVISGVQYHAGDFVSF